MKYNTDIKTLDDFYETLYAVPPRLTREQYTPKSVTQQLLKQLDDPQKQLKSVLVTGSKGKGTSALMLANLLSKSGLNVGLFASPHLFDFRERIVLDGKMIDPRALLQFGKRVLAAANAMEISHPDEFPRFFEVTTAIAYLFFAERQVDYAVIEAGIGALTDAANQDSHCLSILTNIEPEHLNIFGDLQGVANEKSGVMLPNVPLILGDLPESVDQFIIDKAADLSVPVTRFKSKYVPNNSGYYPVKAGEHVWITDSFLKAKNAWIALSAFKQLAINLADEYKVEALETTRLPAREEVVSKAPFIIIDGAHTEQSAINLANYVAKSVKDDYRKLVMLVSFSAKKNIEPVLSAFPKADKIVITQATQERSLSPEKVLKRIQKIEEFQQSNPKIKTIEDPLQALEKTMKKLKKDDVLIITGSVYLAGLISQQFR